MRKLLSCLTVLAMSAPMVTHAASPTGTLPPFSGPSTGLATSFSFSTTIATAAGPFSQTGTLSQTSSLQGTISSTGQFAGSAKSVQTSNFDGHTSSRTQSQGWQFQ
jgi:hypothetical protein